MPVHSLPYLLFLLVVVFLYWLPPLRKLRKWILLFSSYLFYALFDWRFLVILLLLTLVTQWLARLISLGFYPRPLVTLSIVINLGVLAFFKYQNFFLDSFSTLLHATGLGILTPGLSLILPVGLSFYTFQAISYSLEIYRGNLQPAPWMDFALYLAFFPKLIAGPFVRPKSFLSQLGSPAVSIPRQEIAPLLSLLLLGLFKKLVIADALTSQAASAFRVSALPAPGDQYITPLYIQGFYLYAIQIYADFSGYTDIARASAGLLGFKLPENFRQPYLSLTITDFWNRWHMTLTQWFREYLFFPLTRKMLTFTRPRRPALVQVLANLITMLLIGLWHGAGWTFLLWGLWHGIWISVDRWLNWKPERRLASFLAGLLTFHLVGLGWVMFNSLSVSAAINFYKGLFAFDQMSWIVYYLPSIIIPLVVMFGLDLAMKYSFELKLHRFPLLRDSLIVAAIVLILALQLLTIARGADLRPFIYGQF
jgi:alginate O-acetyltransferase complex protein AlgI